MPWTPKDASRHKKGLSAKEARQWSHIANSQLKTCLDQGGSQEHCEGQAIRAANGSVGKGIDTTDLTLVLEAPISKSDDSAQTLFGWASIAVRKDGQQIEDLQGDLIDIEDLEAAWYDYVLESGELNILHKGDCQGQLIEAIVFTPEKLVALGLPTDALPLGAWVGYYVADPACYQMIKAQGFVMFSIEGSAVREAV
jgi:Putative phage serine protease XkdF